MKCRVSDYIANFLFDNNIKQCFMVTGGGAMYLNDSIGHFRGINCIFNHHEQACSIAAEGYYKSCGKIACVCVTSGPGAINALNGVVGAYQDSVPMLVLSGQTKSSLTVKKSGLNLRTLGNQEFDIVSCLKNVCKYSEMITNPNRIAYCLEKSLYIMKEGRPGPCWLDIPVDIQGAYIDIEKLVHFNKNNYVDKESIPDSTKVLNKKIHMLFNKIKQSKRPVIYAGAGIRIANAKNEFTELIKKTNIPVVTCWDSIDLIETNHKNYIGRGGIMGDRAGNFAVQNCDLLICIGTRLNIYQVGYDKSTWAKKAFVVMNDICNNELIKKTIRVDLPICCDCKILINKMLALFDNNKSCSALLNEWNNKCLYWKNNYRVIDENKSIKSKNVNPYVLIDYFSKTIPSNSITVVSNGSASVVGSQTYNIRKNQRFIMNCGLSSMGYDLPAAIGACMGNKKKTVYCIAGDGSIQMNIQELQTIITNNLPIKILLLNNNGYQQIRLTQKNIFSGRKLVGTGKDSNDLSFPNVKKLSHAYGYKYLSIKNNNEIKNVIGELIKCNECCICEVFLGSDYIFAPKSSTKRLANGKLVSPPLEDLAPFLPEEEIKNIME